MPRSSRSRAGAFCPIHPAVQGESVRVVAARGLIWSDFAEWLCSGPEGWLASRRAWVALRFLVVGANWTAFARRIGTTGLIVTSVPILER